VFQTGGTGVAPVKSGVAPDFVFVSVRWIFLRVKNQGRPAKPETPKADIKPVAGVDP